MNARDRIARRAAQYFSDGDVINLGIGIPSLCSDYAPPGVMFHTENGLVGMGPLVDGLLAVEGFSNATALRFVPVPGASVFDSAESFALVRSGKLAATVLGGLQVAENGDLANWAQPGRVFGMGGAMDLVNGARKVIITMELCTKDGKAKVVNSCSYPLTGKSCVDHIVTEQCVIDVTHDGLVLVELLEGLTPDDIQRQVEPKLIVADRLTIMQA
ncbi:MULTISPECIES: 3-oxoacid CoA-transferase subunit B [unclassified Brenneria]|uniref:3-oxoacid CoA-transferase subunit B n=1 Tax=unclassified Brenneria TaxID=2634434 RepID=UPI00155548E6|nr:MULTISPECIES: 3-oxoacid CoA-transferase subunit B [unclassified Brenneria]MBJ7220348.1 3-oxoacid CoA-transferase subunit B [Brenneria sp. L3-3C-1]MEE3641593.1 3-oxoacid CoA-transferase subunit B [Brenneria sp. L3_3C_1]MEE3649776.1 3-oxoacid CoA-transferase subunit B [Brenneria sp. HEZEL_4_2_4]NPC99735.1 3-oxoacid CoA-transferase subunit B [Brenneria sp. hezel4-2-4]